MTSARYKMKNKKTETLTLYFIIRKVHAQTIGSTKRVWYLSYHWYSILVVHRKIKQGQSSTRTCINTFIYLHLLLLIYVETLSKTEQNFINILCHQRKQTLECIQALEQKDIKTLH